MKPRFLKLSLANFGYIKSQKLAKLTWGGVLLYVGASFLLLAIATVVFNLVVAQTSAINGKTAERPERTIIAGDYLS